MRKKKRIYLISKQCLKEKKVHPIISKDHVKSCY